MGFRGTVLGRFAAVAAATLFLGSCARASALPTVPLAVETASGAKVTVVAEIARTEAEQETGYMRRKDIPDGTGMLFAYESDRKMLFWMKNTPHALSIAYVDYSGRIREIHDMTPFSLATVASEGSMRYALEVPQGWFERAGIAVGDRITEDSLRAALAAPAR